jgi:ribosome-associated protein
VREAVRDVEVQQDGIRLGQLLKLAGLVGSGADAKAVLESGDVTVGGRLETRRGRQLQDGDVVALGEQRVRVRVLPG